MIGGSISKILPGGNHRGKNEGIQKSDEKGSTPKNGDNDAGKDGGTRRSGGGDSSSADDKQLMSALASERKQRKVAEHALEGIRGALREAMMRRGPIIIPNGVVHEQKDADRLKAGRAEGSKDGGKDNTSASSMKDTGAAAVSAKGGNPTSTALGSSSSSSASSTSSSSSALGVNATSTGSSSGETKKDTGSLVEAHLATATDIDALRSIATALLQEKVRQNHILQLLVAIYNTKEIKC